MFGDSLSAGRAAGESTCRDEEPEVVPQPSVAGAVDSHVLPEDGGDPAGNDEEAVHEPGQPVGLRVHVGGDSGELGVHVPGEDHQVEHPEDHDDHEGGCLCRAALVHVATSSESVHGLSFYLDEAKIRVVGMPKLYKTCSSSSACQGTPEKSQRILNYNRKQGKSQCM